MAMRISKAEFAKMIDHSIVKAQATDQDVKRYCEEAKTYGFGGIAVNPVYVAYAKELLKGTDIKVDATVGFPFGAQCLEAKIVETKKVLSDGADELDIVMNIGKFRSGDYDYVENELRQIIETAKEEGEKLGKNIVTKVIIEIGYLTDDEIITASRIVSKAGADFVKTATGFGPRGPTLKDIELIKKGISGKTQIKAAQGIRTLKQALEFVKAGVKRLGISTSVNIIKEFTSEYIEI